MAFESDARRLDVKVALARAQRCRGGLAAARGELDAAIATLADACAAAAELGQPFELGRALLAEGTALDGRDGSRKPARRSPSPSPSSMTSARRCGLSVLTGSSHGLVVGLARRASSPQPSSRSQSLWQGAGRTPRSLECSTSARRPSSGTCPRSTGSSASPRAPSWRRSSFTQRTDASGAGEAGVCSCDPGGLPGPPAASVVAWTRPTKAIAPPGEARSCASWPWPHARPPACS